MKLIKLFYEKILIYTTNMDLLNCVTIVYFDIYLKVSIYLDISTLFSSV